MQILFRKLNITFLQIIAKNPCPKPWPLLKFKPLHINNLDDYGSLSLPSNINTHKRIKLFSLFFIDKIMDKLVE